MNAVQTLALPDLPPASGLPACRAAAFTITTIITVTTRPVRAVVFA
ncbi:hypothetical protein [Stenotrophomonas sp. YIM B06876]|nr:hypothetical protein [Stenotrophomonas sp. YIM B06876]